MTSYLVKMKPMDTFAFGTDVKFHYKGESDESKSSYITKSNMIPPQTTILGMLRFMVLDTKDKLSDSSKEEAGEPLDEYIGKASFQFDKEDQEFGYIKSVSPVFIMKETQNHQYDKFVKNPIHNIKSIEQDWHFIQMSDQNNSTTIGNIALPVEDLKGLKNTDLFINISSKNKETEMLCNEDIFTSEYEVRTSKTTDKDQQIFFKQQMFKMKDSFSFGFYVELDNDFKPKSKSPYFVGQNHSTFCISFTEEKDNLIELLQNRFADEKDRWYYALSDIYFEEEPEYENYYMLNKKSMRNLVSVYRGNKYQSTKKSKSYSMIASGSVFYKENPFKIKQDNKYRIGYNHIVEIGGNHEN